MMTSDESESDDDDDDTATDTELVTDLVGNRHLPASPSLIKLNQDNAKARKNGNN